MPKLKPLPNKSEMHISFYDDSGKLVTEFIPKDTNMFYLTLKWKYINLLLRLNRPIYYWNIRFGLPYQVKKAEDLRFIDHVIVDHDGNPPTLRENIHFSKAINKYGLEYDRLARAIFEANRENHNVDHPYAKAYVKMWKLDRQPMWKMTYHGMNRDEFLYILNTLAESFTSEAKKARRRWRYHEKKQKLKK